MATFPVTQDAPTWTTMAPEDTQNYNAPYAPSAYITEYPDGRFPLALPLPGSLMPFTSMANDTPLPEVDLVSEEVALPNKNPMPDYISQAPSKNNQHEMAFPILPGNTLKDYPVVPGVRLAPVFTPN